MPNIVGIWQPGSSAKSIEQTLKRQLDIVRTHVTRYDEHIHVGDGFGAANQTHGIFAAGHQPVYNAGRSISLLLDGELVNTEELRSRYRDILPDRRLGSAEICMILLTKFGTDIAIEFLGSFIIVLYDSDTATLTLISDRLGFRPLFFVDRGDHFIFATELKGIIEAERMSPAVSELGLLELFSYKTHVFGRTWIDGYERLRPATVMTVSPGRRSAKPYWTYRFAESATRLDQETYFTVYAKLLDRSVDRAMRGNGRIGIFLSGGYDSRCIAGAIRRHHAPIPAITFGHKHSRDVVFGRMIAERLGFEHETISRTGAYLFPNAEGIAWRTEGMLPFANTTSIEHHPAIKARMDIILAGFLGEFSGSHLWPELLVSRSRRSAIDAIFKRLVESRAADVRRVFRTGFYEQNFEALRSDFFASFNEIDNDHPHNVSDVWNFRYFHPQETYHAPAVDRHLFEVRTPLTDADLVDFLLTIPPYSRIEQRVYKKMIAYSYPSLRDVPCTNSGRPIDPMFAREYTKMTLDWGLRAISKRLGIGSGESNRDFRDLADDFRAEPELITRILTPMIQSEIFPAKIFDIDGIKSIVEEHYESGGRHHMLLANLIGWGLAAKQLLHGERASIPMELTGGED